MKLIIEEDLQQEEVEITIKCSLLDDRLKKLIAQIRAYSFSIHGRKDGATKNILLEDICYFESVDETTYMYCSKDVYECDEKLYELEINLRATSFVRISKSIILNIEYVSHVKPLFDGKYEATLLNHENVIVNRHYVKAFKEKFML